MKKAILIQTVEKNEDIEVLQSRGEELVQLAETYGKVKIAEIFSKKTKVDLKLFLRSGLRDEILMACKKHDAEVVILGNILKPRQLYEISEIFREENIEVMDRVDLILNIFSQHAKSSEAKLQIQLAKIRHMGPRIFGMGGDELSKQSAGGRGQGETNTEVMKRHLARERKKIEEKLEKLEKTKALHRARRKKQNFKSVALVGYTNAGKSSLMNILSKKGVAAEDALFKTLDTRIGKMYLPDLQKEICISDTIGFIDDLPPNLISAFSSTLSEAVSSDIILHVIDISDPRRLEKIKIVDDILESLGAKDIPQILVCNKLDLAGKKFGRARFRRKFSERFPVFLSAKTKKGFENLRWRLENMFERMN